jgi:outer membrane protein
MYMMRWTRGFALAAGLVVAAVCGMAQPKMGIVNIQKALQDTAEIKQAEADLKAKFGPRQEELAKLEKDLAAMQADYDKNQTKYTEAALADLAVKIQRRQRDGQRMGQLLQEEVNRERQDVLTRSGQRMQEVIKKVAEEKGLDMIVDSATLLYTKPALDLAAEVTAAYDKAYPVKK